MLGRLANGDILVYILYTSKNCRPQKMGEIISRKDRVPYGTRNPHRLYAKVALGDKI